MGTHPGETLLIVGLGNPGPEHSKTRHNIGAMVVERLASLMRLKLAFSRRLGAWTARRGNVVLARPKTFMNESGPAVARIARAVKTDAPLLVHDDLDLPLGTIRFRTRGSSGGHRGIESVISALGTDRFPRLKMGIGRPDEKRDVVDFVLSPFTDPERETLDETLGRAASALREAVSSGLERAMSRHSQ